MTGCRGIHGLLGVRVARNSSITWARLPFDRSGQVLNASPTSVLPTHTEQPLFKRKAGSVDDTVRRRVTSKTAVMIHSIGVVWANRGVCVRMGGQLSQH